MFTNLFTGVFERFLGGGPIRANNAGSMQGDEVPTEPSSGLASALAMMEHQEPMEEDSNHGVGQNTYHIAELNSPSLSLEPTTNATVTRSQIRQGGDGEDNTRQNPMAGRSSVLTEQADDPAENPDSGWGADRDTPPRQQARNGNVGALDNSNARRGREVVYWTTNDVDFLLAEKAKCERECPSACTWSVFHTRHWTPAYEIGRTDGRRNYRAIQQQYNKLVTGWRPKNYRNEDTAREIVAVDSQPILLETHGEVDIPGDIEPVGEPEGDSLQGEAVLEPMGTPIVDGPAMVTGPQETGGTERPEENPLGKEVQRLFRRIFNSMPNKFDRKPLAIPRRTRKETWTLLDKTANKYLVSRSGKSSLDRVNKVVYCIGVTLEKIDKISKRDTTDKNKEWYNAQRREELHLREYIGWITDELRRRREGSRASLKQKANFAQIRRRYGIKTRCELEQRLYSLKEQLKLLKNRVKLRRDDESRKRTRFTQPSRTISAKDDRLSNIDINAHRSYWDEIIGQNKPYEKTAALLEWENSLSQTNQQVLSKTIAEEREAWERRIRKFRPWKAPGPDGIPNIMWKRLGSASEWVFKWLMDVKRRDRKVPNWLCQGRIVLLPKKAGASEPGDFRPIACLNTCYKLVTGHITTWITEHVDAERLMPSTQRALTKGTWGCTHAHIIDRTITLDALSRRAGVGRKLACAWLDYAKAFDSVSHAFVKHVLRVLKVDSRIRRLLTRLMSNWTVKYEARTEDGLQKSRPLRVKNGVLQGDTLSPLIFCLTLGGIADALNRQIPMYETATLSGRVNGGALKLNHILYVDDGKLLTRNRDDLDRAIQLVDRESKAIGLRLNADKCAIAELGNGDQPTGRELDRIPIVGMESAYKYLGVEQRIHSREDLAWCRVKRKAIGKVEGLLTADLSAGQVVQGLNSIVNPVMRYLHLNTIVGRGKYIHVEAKAKRFDMAIRRLMAKHRMSSRTLSATRPYISAKNGGLGIKAAIDVLHEATIYAWCYVQCTESLVVTRALFRTQTLRNKRTIDSDARKVLREITGLTWKATGTTETSYDPTMWGLEIDGTSYTNPTKAARAIVSKMRQCKEQDRLGKWTAKILAGRVPRSDQILKPLSFMWLHKGRMNLRCWRDALLVQEGQTRTNVMTKTSGGLCRQCKKAKETVPHIVAGCGRFRTTLMLDRHNWIARALHQALCKKFGLGTTHYTQQIMPVMENERAKLLWDVNVVTRKVLKCNRPDMVLFDKERRKVFVIEFSCTWFTVLAKQHRVKVHKYATNSMTEKTWQDLGGDSPQPDRNLLGELGELYGKEYPEGFEVLAMIVGVSGEVLPNLPQDLEKLGFEQRQILELVEKFQREAVIGTSRLIRAHLGTKG